MGANILILVVLALSAIYVVSSEKHIVCYYGTWATYRQGLGKFDVSSVDPKLCTHLIYTFVGIQEDGTVKSLDPWLDLPDDSGRDNFKQFNELKQTNPDLKTLLAVGGWNEGSAKYSTTVANDLQYYAVTYDLTPAQATPEPKELKTATKLYETLSSCNEGKGLLLRFQETGLLDNAARRRLCQLIINNELKNDPEKKLSSSWFYQTAYEIAQIYVKENPAIYFTPFMSFGTHEKSSAKGKLLDCYRQKRRDFLKHGLIKGKEKICDSAEPQLDVEEGDLEDQLLWLKESCDPWEKVEKNWDETTKKRMNMLQSENLTIKEYYAAFKALNQQKGLCLMAANPQFRANFISSALRFILEYGFDGFDLDWEYPAHRDTVFGQSDVENFSQLLREMRQEFDQHHLLLTAAVAPTKETVAFAYNITALHQNLDIINLMTYDLYVATESKTSHNAGLFKGEGDEDKDPDQVFSVDAAVQYWLSQGCPPSKLAVGVPFYGHTFTLTDPAVNGVKSPSSGPGFAGPYTATRGTIGYSEFCDLLRTQSWDVRRDELAKVPYAVQGSNWVSYDDPQSITDKVNYVLEKDLGGIMIWSIETDDFNGLCGEKFILLKTINRALYGDVQTTTTITATPPTTNFTSTTTSTGTTTTTSTSQTTTTSTSQTTTTSNGQTTTTSTSQTTTTSTSKTITTSTGQTTTTSTSQTTTTNTSKTTTTTSTGQTTNSESTKTTSSTITDSTVITNPTTSKTWEPSIEAGPQETTADQVPTTVDNDVSDDQICRNNGDFKRNLDDCSKYYVCVDDGVGGLRKLLMVCPGGLFWDQSLLTCNDPQSVNCDH